MSDTEEKNVANVDVNENEENDIIHGAEEQEGHSESEGEDVFDSSADDEEDEEDEEEAAKVKEGFIVDEDGSENEDEDEEQRKEERRRRKKRRTEEDVELDEDDLDLLMENAGYSNGPHKSEKGKLKRLKRAGRLDSDEEEENVEEGASGASASGSQRSTIINDFFSDDEEEEEEEELDHEEVDHYDHKRKGKPHQAPVAAKQAEFDDFIEDDEFSDEDEETRQQRLQERKKQREKNPLQVTGLSADKIDEMFEIFGDGHEYDWALDLEKEDEGEGIAEGSVQLEDIYDLQDLKQNLMTEEDMVIRRTDIPERFQELRKGLTDYEPLVNEEFDSEVMWISSKLASVKQVPEAYIQEFHEAIGNAINFISKENLEVPFVYSYRKNDISSKDTNGFILNETDLWEIVHFDVEFHSLLSKKKYIVKFYRDLDIHDSVVEEYLSSNDLNILQDIYNYLEFNYASEINATKNHTQNAAYHKKTHLKNSSYEKFKNSKLYQVVEKSGISTVQLGENINAGTQVYVVKDPEDDLSPEELVELTVADDVFFSSNLKLALETVEKYFALEMSQSPKIREAIRKNFYSYYVANVNLLPKGQKEIQLGSPYEDIKYAINRTPQSFLQQPETFLKMLEAEQQHYLTVEITMSSQEGFIDHVFDTCLESGGTNEVATKWNQFRKKVFVKAINKIFQDVSNEIKAQLQKVCENLVMKAIKREFLKKLDQAPFVNNHKKASRVLAVTCGNGKFGTDAIIGVLVNRKSLYEKDHKFVNNPFDRLNSKQFDDEFKNLCMDLQPDCIAINGPNVATQRFMKKLQDLIQYEKIENKHGNLLPVVFVDDQVATLYQHSKKSEIEYPNKNHLVKYCIALGRYVHSPLLEYANLSHEELCGLNIHPHQKLLSSELVNRSLETAFVDIVNLVGVDFSKISSDNPYYCSLLPYLSGFGKRKTIDFMENLQRLNEALVARQQLITKKILTKTIFINASGFIKMSWKSSSKMKNGRDRHSSTGGIDEDLLDGTRIHPEDYQLAAKVAADALEASPEEIQDHEETGEMGEFVEILSDDRDKQQKLESLDLNSFAKQYEEETGKRKFNVLRSIVYELIDGFEELRSDFHIMRPHEIFYNLTGETEESFHIGSLVPVKIDRYRNHNEIICSTNSNIECNISSTKHEGYYKRDVPVDELYELGKTYPSKVLSIDYANIKCEGSLLKHDTDLSSGGAGGVNGAIDGLVNTKINRDANTWDIAQEMADLAKEKELTMRERRAKRQHRVINHPYYFAMNGKQAEEYLKPKERGEFVIRQSSKGDDHLTITWKLDKDLFEHIDIKEEDKFNPLYLGNKLIVDGVEYNDLDHIIVEYLQNKIRLLNELTFSEKFKNGSKREVVKFIEDYSKVNPNRSVYYFSFNHEHPGWFYLMFKLNATSKLYIWNVKLTKNGYQLVNFNYPSVIQLCNGFKNLLKANSAKQRTQPPHM
ncbi:hypothetical protein ACO0RG_000168 [Hanseniaspora osmophila]|uniref:Transcription elongation factor Spt6 n=1 Tax=Hanseniaspora osmophila TaxID=56408 RepID=A0A1E5R584_9ASCO|nr:Transcription elongation factor SPT6 [Hanseniaspora osmophila]